MKNQILFLIAHVPFFHLYYPLIDENKERLDFLMNRNYFQSSACLYYLTQLGLHIKILDVFPVNDLLLFNFGRGRSECLSNLNEK